MRTVSIIWKCQCMSKERAFEMRERGRREAIRDWMEDVQHVLTGEHDKASPLCTSGKVEYIKIEHQTGEMVGKAGGGNA